MPIGIIDAGAKLVDPAILPFGVGVAIFSSALPYTLEMVALRRLSTKALGTLMSFEPALAAGRRGAAARASDDHAVVGDCRHRRGVRGCGEGRAAGAGYRAG